MAGIGAVAVKRIPKIERKIRFAIRLMPYNMVADVISLKKTEDKKRNKINYGMCDD